jgi:hypothetical protein
MLPSSIASGVPNQNTFAKFLIRKDLGSEFRISAGMPFVRLFSQMRNRAGVWWEASLYPSWIYEDNPQLGQSRGQFPF